MPTPTSSIDFVADIPGRHASASPDRIALYFADRSLNYRALAGRSNRVANGLIALGIAPQSRVIFLSKNDDRFFELLFGAALARMALAPVNWRLSAEELTFIIGDSDATVLFVSREYAELARRIAADLPLLRHVFVLDAEAGDTQDYTPWRDAQSDDEPDSERRAAADDVLQLYTSGTTGLPKGARLTNANLIAYLRYCGAGRLGRFDEGALVMLALPVFHVGGACWGLNAIYQGRADVVVREASAPLIIEAFARHRITKAGLVPSVMKMMLEHPDAAQADFSHLDTVTYGASPISPELLKQALAVFGCGFVQMFGMTESTSIATFLPPEDHDLGRPERMLSVGRVVEGVGLRIVDAQGADVAEGQSGEILLSGATIMKGYWKQPDATAKAIVDGWYATGDVGCLDADGFLYLRDRVKDMIISGGENVYSAEVERVLSDHPAIHEVAVIGVPDDRWGEAVKAVVVLRAGCDVDESDLTVYARSRLAGFKCPKSIDFVAVLPRNGVGKVLKRLLREPYWKDHARSVA